MSAINRSMPTASGLFQAHFGAAPGNHDAKVECEKWERLCGELLAERERLRAELEKAKLEAFWKEYTPTLTMAEVYAQVDRETPIEQLIAELEAEAESQ